MLDKLMNTLGKLCFGGLDQVAAEYAKQSKQNADDAKDKLEAIMPAPETKPRIKSSSDDTEAWDAVKKALEGLALGPK